MEIILASDHAGFPIKQHIVNHLKKHGYSVVDLGTNTEQSVDYPDFGHALAERLTENTVGIALCGSGIGISMALNRHPHVRAALCWNSTLAALARQHNDANVCVLPGRFVTLLEAEAIVDTFLTEKFEGGRHQKRIEKLNP